MTLRPIFRRNRLPQMSESEHYASQLWGLVSALYRWRLGNILILSGPHQRGIKRRFDLLDAALATTGLNPRLNEPRQLKIVNHVPDRALPELVVARSNPFVCFLDGSYRRE